jgi:hypothetical protein
MGYMEYNMTRKYEAFRKWGAEGGRTKSPAKAAAARKNGKLGGRPKRNANPKAGEK